MVQTTRRRDAEASKAAILEAAREIFLSRGFGAARVGEIARTAGVPQGLIYHYFDSKEILFHTVVHDVLAPYFASTTEMLRQGHGREGLELLDRAIDLYFNFLRENPDVVRLMAWSASAQIRARVPELFADMLTGSPMELGIQRLREAQEAGAIRSDMEPAHIIKMFLDLCVHWFMSLDDFCLDAQVPQDDPGAIDRLHDDHLRHIRALVRTGLAPGAESAD
jgi:TetR/AcrR family transcriptional regulator